jgi:hypothetical protein
MEIGQLIYMFFNTAGPGGLVVMLIFGGALTLYTLLTRWIIAGGANHEPDQAMNMDS